MIRNNATYKLVKTNLDLLLSKLPYLVFSRTNTPLIKTSSLFTTDCSLGMFQTRTAFTAMDYDRMLFTWMSGQGQGPNQGCDEDAVRSRS